MPFPVSGKGGMRRPSMLQPSPQTTAADKVPAPIAGINAVSNIAEMGPQDAVELFNLIPARNGTRVRTGYREHCTNVGTGGVKTVIPFIGSIAIENRLFACAGDGIYEVSASTDAPTLVEAFPVEDETSGYGVWQSFTTVGGRFSLYCDETNGYYIWRESTDVWDKIAAGSAAGEIDGVDPAEFVGVTVYKNRPWFVRKNSALAYYLPAGLITGTVTEFNFGNKFTKGGYLVALYTWTLDGGDNALNVYLVALSSAGDVIVYQGNDPDVPGNFKEVGNWFIGEPPAGRRLAGSFGGELYLLSSYGLLPMSKLLAGALVQKEDIYLTRRITPLINSTMALTRDSLGWEVRLVPSENLILISTPKQTGLPYDQFVQAINSQGWSIYRDIPHFTGDVWLGNYYIGTEDNRILIHSGNLDNVLLDDPDEATQIEWSGLTAFRDPGDPGQFNRAHFIRPVFMAQQPPSYTVEARYDYNIAQVTGVADAAPPSGAVWDVAIWDVSFWGGDFQIIQDPKGAAGMGRSIAIALKGRSGSETTLIRFDIMSDGGGLL